MLEVFGVLTIWFWVWLVLGWVTLTVTTENDYPGLGTLALLALLALLQWLIGVPVLQWIWHNPFTTLALVGVYFFAGTIWAFIKWWFFVTGELRNYDAVRDAYLKDIAKLPPGKVPEHVKPDFIEYMKRVYGPRYMERIKPSPSNHKSQIMTWLGFWPFSAAWTLLNDPLRRACEAIYNTVASTLQRISDYVFKQVEADLTMPPERPATKLPLAVDVPSTLDPNATVCTPNQDLPRSQG